MEVEQKTFGPPPRSHFMWTMTPGEIRHLRADELAAANVKATSVQAFARVVKQRSKGERQFSVTFVDEQDGGGVIVERIV